MAVLSRFELFELVCDGTKLTGASAVLLYQIAWRANPAEKYSCYLSTERLVDETHYTEQILHVAAKKLEAEGLITRVKRSKRSTIFFLNVRKLMQMAEAAKDAKKNQEKDPSLGSLDPTTPPTCTVRLNLRPTTPTA
jgi:hypothetical protein